MSLDDVLGRLRRQDRIDGLMVVGSAARDELGPASDYDLVLVFDELAVQADIGSTVIDGRDTDLRFLTVEELDEFVGSDGPIDPYSGNGRAFLRMGDGKIELDRHGLLEKAKEKVGSGVELKLFDDHQKYSRWWMVNYFLRIAKRLNRSDDPVYAGAVDLQLMGMLDYLMLDYFNFRDILWKGEKDAVRYWAEHDPEYLDLFTRCSHEPDRNEKLRRYEELAKLTGRPMGDVWAEGATSLHVRQQEGATPDIASSVEEALDFWDGLVGDP